MHTNRAICNLLQFPAPLSKPTVLQVEFIQFYQFTMVSHDPNLSSILATPTNAHLIPIASCITSHHSPSSPTCRSLEVVYPTLPTFRNSFKTDISYTTAATPLFPSHITAPNSTTPTCYISGYDRTYCVSPSINAMCPTPAQVPPVFNRYT